MIEYHGWAVIRESYDEQRESPEKMKEIIKCIEDRILRNDTTNEFYDLRPLNGSVHLTIQAAHNHRSDAVILFFKWIADIAAGSYGLLYIHDDEDHQRGNENRFMVWRMKKGQVDEVKDNLLSPYFPTLEDPVV